MKWKPSKSQRRAFAEKMANDAEYAQAYHNRKEARKEKDRAGSAFAYDKAGGSYYPTTYQVEVSHRVAGSEDPVLAEAARQIVYADSVGEKVHHDYIHVLNEFIRKSRE